MNSEKVGLNAFEKGVIAIIPVISAAVFYFLPSLLHFIEMIPFLPDIQLINFILELENDWINWVIAGIGLILGIFLSIFIFTEILKVEVNRDYVTVDIFDKKTDIQKSDIESIF